MRGCMRLPRMSLSTGPFLVGLRGYVTARRMRASIAARRRLMNADLFKRARHFCVYHAWNEALPMYPQ